MSSSPTNTKAQNKSKRFSLSLFSKSRRGFNADRTSSFGAIPTIYPTSSISPRTRSSSTADLPTFLQPSRSAEDLSSESSATSPESWPTSSSKSSSGDERQVSCGHSSKHGWLTNDAYGTVGGSVRLTRKRATVSFETTAFQNRMREMASSESFLPENPPKKTEEHRQEEEEDLGEAKSSVAGTPRRRAATLTNALAPGCNSTIPAVSDSASPRSLRSGQTIKRSNSLVNVRAEQNSSESERKHASLELDMEKEDKKLKKEVRRLLRTSKSLNEGERKRNMVINEIITTEETYIHDLEVMIELFRNPMLKENVASKDDVNAVFSNILQLVEVNRMFYQELMLRLATSNGNELGDCFLLLGDYLKMYTTYCGNQDTARDTLDRCKSNKNFTAFLARAHLDQRAKHLILRDYLIKPVQRICKYPLLLKELIKNTDVNHSDYTKLTSALDKIQKAVASVNEKKQHEEEMAAVARIIARLNNTEGIQLMVPGRKYLQEGMLLEAPKDRREFRPRHYFLFSDVLILTNGQSGQQADGEASKKAVSKLEVVSIIPMSEAKMEFNLTSSGSDMANTIEIESCESIYILPFLSLELKLKWAQRHSSTASSAVLASALPERKLTY